MRVSMRRSACKGRHAREAGRMRALHAAACSHAVAATDVCHCFKALTKATHGRRRLTSVWIAAKGAAAGEDRGRRGEGPRVDGVG